MKKPIWKIWIENKKECGYWLNSYIKKNILRKTEDEPSLYLKKTNHNLNFANWIFEKHDREIKEIFGNETFYDWIINIYYYAVYHAALALICKEGYSSKNHSASLCFLIYHNYHLQKVLNKEDFEVIASSLDKEDIETIGDAKELRERASYNVHDIFEKKLAEQTRDKSVNFVNKIKIIIEEVKLNEDMDRDKKGKEKSKDKNSEINA